MYAVGGNIDAVLIRRFGTHYITGAVSYLTESGSDTPLTLRDQTHTHVHRLFILHSFPLTASYWSHFYTLISKFRGVDWEINSRSTSEEYGTRKFITLFTRGATRSWTGFKFQPNPRPCVTFHNLPFWPIRKKAGGAEGERDTYKRLALWQRRVWHAGVCLTLEVTEYFIHQLSGLPV
jgi:hypothetical protein